MASGYRRLFDPDRYRIIGLDQRGCGRSRPLAIDDLTTLGTNTTAHLIADMEALRVHLGVEKWLVYGASWGTCLALAYAQAFPDRVTEILLAAVALPTPNYVEWITGTVGRIFPVEWDRFERASKRRDGERLVDAYARLLTSSDPTVRAQAAREWCAWEDAHVSLDPNRAPGSSYPTRSSARCSRPSLPTIGATDLSCPPMAHLPRWTASNTYPGSSPTVPTT